MSFEPFQTEANGEHRARSTDNPMALLQCSLPSCGKWRRVDQCTCDLFTTREWVQDSLQEYAKEHTESLEALRLHLRNQLDDETEELDMDGFTAVLLHTGLDVTTPLREIAAIDICEQVLTDHTKQKLSESVLNHRITLFSSSL